jgi:F-type H+-transporting ATPase subunit b
MLTRAEQEIAHEREQALITLRQQVVDLTLSATEKVIGDSLDENRQRRLIDEFITTAAVNNGAARVYGNA